MTAPTYKTLNQLVAAAELFIDDVDIISFDVFDTIFIRRIEDPDLIKIPVARFIADKANKLGIDISWHEVATKREEIESQQRQRNGLSFPDYEACYDNFMPQMLNQVFGSQLPDNFFQQVADYEMSLENAVLVPREKLIDWIKLLKQRDKRLFLISDIYLPAKYIARLVEDKGLSHYFEAIISSADSFNAKASGTAYPLVEKQFELDKSRWLHVGDNPISDGTRPQEFGIRALVINDPRERHRKLLAKKYNHYSTHNNFWKGRNMQQLMLPLEADNCDHDDLYVQGFNQFGFVFGYFMQRLAEQCKQLGLKRIYFCSREGWMLQKCWELFAPWYFADGEMPETKYLYVSRIALARAMIGNAGISQLEVDVALLPSGNESFMDVCRIFGLEAAAFEPYLKAKDLTLDEVISQTEKSKNDASRRKLGLLLLDSEFQAQARQAAQPYRDAFVNYLESEGFFQLDEVALVDIGWLGTIHNNFFKALSHLHESPTIHGYLMCATRYIEYNYPRGTSVDGLVYDRHKLDMGASLLEYIKDIIEEICRAPHTSLVSYNPDTSETGFNLEFRSDSDASAKAERVQSAYYQPLQQGIIDGVEAYAKAYAIHGYSTEVLKSWLNFSLHRYIAFPKTQDVLRMQIKAHQDDFGKRDTANLKNALAEKGLWQCSAAALRCLPGLRSRRFKKHCLTIMRSS